YYLRCDTALSNRNALARLRLNLDFVVDDPPIEEPAVSNGPSVIDRQAAVAPKPDDVYVSGVVWEYYNGLGWKNLPVSGNKNPFAAREAGQGEIAVTFRVPADLREIEVNAEPGLYIRARVTNVENQYSLLQRWILPFVKEAAFTWQYLDASASPLPRADWAAAENNGARREIPNAAGIAGWRLPAFQVMEAGEEAMYFRFDRSPHAMPLSVRFWMEGRTRMEEEIQWEARTAAGFVSVQCVDRTENLLHSGEMYLFLPEPLSEAELFGQRGYWLRLRRTSLRAAPSPVVRSVELNTVGAAQVERRPVQVFDTDVYEVGKAVQVMHTPVWGCRVWVDELAAMTPEEARLLARESRGRAVLAEEGHQITRCWILWDRVADLALAGPEDRAFSLDPWTGEIRFGDGVHGRIPPQGDGNIQVEYNTTRGAAGNVAPGVVKAPLNGLPRISSMTNLTAMSGGTGRLKLETIEAVGGRRLRHRGRACGRQDYEDLVTALFPQVRHVRCFPGRDQQGRDAPGHVTVAVAGYGEQSEEQEALCRAIYAELSRRSSCCLTAEGRLHVCPAVELTVNVQATLELDQPEYAAETQQAVVRRLNELIDGTWRNRPIGEQIRLSEIWSTVRETENVR
ncbi:MAG: baseplate J/gp47 family protein, partial [Oscillibacter sp.]|nr:baseplate J/gp47 family protein [Oscillibacter sp.]